MSHDGHRSSGLHPGLHNQDEAEAIESVIRTAVDAVLSVMCGAYNRRMLEYQRMVADRDKEIWSLKCKLQKSELDEETMQMPEDELPCSATCRSNASLSGEEVNQLKTEPEEKCCDVGAVTPTLISPDCRDTMGAFPHQRAPSAAVFEESDAGAAGAQSPGWATVKEDDPGPVIEWEMCEESCADLQQSAGGVAHYQKPANIAAVDAAPKIASFLKHRRKKLEARLNFTCQRTSLKKKQQKKIKINIGIMCFQHGTMKPVRGRTLPLIVDPDTDAAELHLLAVKKMTDFHSDLEEGPYVLIYPDRTEVNIIPGTLKPFTVREYKAEIGKPYNRITLFICRKTDYDRSEQQDTDEETDDEDLVTEVDLPTRCPGNQKALEMHHRPEDASTHRNDAPAMRRSFTGVCVSHS